MSIRVFVVDDSAVVRKVLSELINESPGMEVIGIAQDPIFAHNKMKKDWPDVIVLDVEMPRMDGITFLKNLMEEKPTPVVMCSTLTKEGSKVSLQALSLGAIEVVEKPKISLDKSLNDTSEILINAIRTAAKANLGVLKKRPGPTFTAVPKKLTADAMLSKGSPKAKACVNSSPLIAIGASTGGTQALESVLSALPASTPPILVVQHMPENFTSAFAARLNSLCELEVKEAQDNDLVKFGRVLIAPGGKHMMLQANSNKVCVQVKDGPLVCRHRPSVDVLFRSVAKFSGKHALGIIMTGMGDDGARGIKEMRDSGCKTIAQDMESCVVYGMPKEAVKLGAILQELSLSDIPRAITKHQ